MCFKPQAGHSVTTRIHAMKIIRSVLAVGLGAALVTPLVAQQSDPSQQNTSGLNSFATPSPTASPTTPRDTDHKKHQRRHRGKRRQARKRDQNSTMTGQRRQTRDHQQNGAGIEQRRQQETDLAPSATGSEVKTAPENAAPQPEAVPQPTPH